MTQRVVILSAYDDREIVQLAIAAGATGYVSKDSPPEEIVRAVCRAADGEAALPNFTRARPSSTGSDTVP